MFAQNLCTELGAQNKILASKMRNLKQQKTSAFAPLILKRRIEIEVRFIVSSVVSFNDAVCLFVCFQFVFNLFLSGLVRISSY